MANSGEFQTVSTKFKKDWVKGQCPSVSYVFVIMNTPLGKRYDAYRKKLSDQTREEHYHGTKLKCNIMQDWRTCSDSDCDICGISSMGLDQRYIQKNMGMGSQPPAHMGIGPQPPPAQSQDSKYLVQAHQRTIVTKKPWSPAQASTVTVVSAQKLPDQSGPTNVSGMGSGPAFGSAKLYRH